MGLTMLLLLLGCVGGVRAAAAARDRDLLPANAAEVQFGTATGARQSLSFRLPPGESLATVRRTLLQRGWQPARGPNFDRSSMVLTRNGMFQTVREIVVMTARPDDRRMVDMYVTRCLRLGSWVRCP
jgi:hypothetical protein